MNTLWNLCCPLFSRCSLRPRSSYRHEDEATTSGATQENDQERVIFVNKTQPIHYAKNTISTAKYNMVTFVPLFLFEQFRRYSNCFFLMIALLQQIPDVSPTGRWTTLTPLIFILSVSALKEIVEDIKRHRADDETNRRSVQVLRDNAWRDILWRELQLGDVCRVLNDQFFPADLVLLSSSEPQGMSFIETSNLDGETNLKVRQAQPRTARLLQPEDFASLSAVVKCEPPNRHLYEFNGSFKETNARTEPLGLEQMLLRGARLRNTAWVVAVVVYTGHETKLMMNSTEAPLKRSTLDKQTNKQILTLFLLLVTISIVSATFSILWDSKHSATDWYIGLEEAQRPNFLYSFLTFLILFNNLIPISLQVTAEIVRYVQAYFIAWDCRMYDPVSDRSAAARTSNLNEELGMVRYVFSDKTGTLTCNVMQFQKCWIDNEIYPAPLPGEPITTSTMYAAMLRAGPNDRVRRFLTALAVCHTVIPETVDGELHYHAASPDERALVLGASQFGYVFARRSPDSVEVDTPLGTERYRVLNVLEFTSARKRMSVVVKNEAGEIVVMTKGADSVVCSRLAAGQNPDDMLQALETFAADGLRTLVFASTVVRELEYRSWSEIYFAASISSIDRERKLEEAASLIEKDMELLGATAIEDKLQDGVPETIAALLEASIKVWVLTGDKAETAINIGYASRLVKQTDHLLILNDQGLDNTRASILRHVSELGARVRQPHDLALVIEGTTLKYAMGCDLKKDFLDLCLSCNVVICCRVSPLQKAEVVEMVSRATGAVTLAVGDGANDVAMIQRACVGVGISGMEGLQAVCASDYSIAQFRFLLNLLLVHGAWNYARISKLILYCYYKNICFYVIELWFAIYSAWSGEILFERWTIGFYNVIFTALPPFAIGIFDKLCSADIMLRHPALYRVSQHGELFNARTFWAWLVQALAHSLLLYWLPALAAGHLALWRAGRVGDSLALGIIVYTYVVCTVCLKAGLVSYSWTWVTHVSIWGSLVIWLLFVVVYSHVYPTLPLGAEFHGKDAMVLSAPLFWLGLLVLPTATLLPDLLLSVIHNTAFKTITEAVRESEIKKRDPDALLHSHHRQSLTETARLLHNVRSVFGRRSTRTNIELELSHGFAFSQEEGGTVSQSDVIRAYERHQSEPRTPPPPPPEHE